MARNPNNRYTKYVLPVAVAVWGLFFFRLYRACNPGTEMPKGRTEPVRFTPPETERGESYRLVPMDRDPFLGKATTAKKNTGSTGASTKTDSPWPSIRYLGTVSGTGTKKTIFVVNINGRQHLLSRGQDIDGVRLVSGNDKKVTLRFGGTVKEFEKP